MKHEETKSEQCMVCGGGLEYLGSAQNMVCTACGKKEEGHIRCLQGHYICEECHDRDAVAVIQDIAFTTGSPDPLETAERMMAHPAVPMLGCQHAYIAAGALLSSLRNAWSDHITNDAIREAFRRLGSQARGGSCGLTGVCGIAPAIGACFSIFLGSRCGTNTEQRLTMEAVTRVCRVITDLTGPSCCKAYVRSALLEAVSMFEEHFSIILPVQDRTVVCSDSGRHPHGCRAGSCPYYQEQSKDIFAQSVHLPTTFCST